MEREKYDSAIGTVENRLEVAVRQKIAARSEMLKNLHEQQIPEEEKESPEELIYRVLFKSGEDEAKETESPAKKG